MREGMTELLSRAGEYKKTSLAVASALMLCGALAVWVSSKGDVSPSRSLRAEALAAKLLSHTGSEGDFKNLVSLCQGVPPLERRFAGPIAQEKVLQEASAHPWISISSGNLLSADLEIFSRLPIERADVSLYDHILSDAKGFPMLETYLLIQKAYALATLGESNTSEVHSLRELLNSQSVRERVEEAFSGRVESLLDFLERKECAGSPSGTKDASPVPC